MNLRAAFAVLEFGFPSRRPDLNADYLRVLDRPQSRGAFLFSMATASNVLQTAHEPHLLPCRVGIHASRLCFTPSNYP